MSGFKREYYLVGGTAIALHIGHRQSIYFDMFKKNELKISKIISKISEAGYSYIVTCRVSEQLNLIINKVKLTFFQYPFSIETPCKYENIFKMPDLLTLSAMKAYALSRRSKWKDYVDLYFVLKKYYSINDITEKAIAIYGDLFSEKLFRAQICYFEDIDFSEPVIFLDEKPSEEDIKTFLIETAINF
jgi:hypothetical protein